MYKALNLASYPDVANTMAAQSLQCLDLYSSNMIDLPPAIEHIYATNDLNGQASRFNHPVAGS